MRICQRVKQCSIYHLMFACTRQLQFAEAFSAAQLPAGSQVYKPSQAFQNAQHWQISASCPGVSAMYQGCELWHSQKHHVLCKLPFKLSADCRPADTRVHAFRSPVQCCGPLRFMHHYAFTIKALHWRPHFQFVQLAIAGHLSY